MSSSRGGRRSPETRRNASRRLLGRVLINAQVAEVRFRGEDRTLSGHRRRAESDPIQTWAAQEFCSARALFAPSLKRDIVSSIARTRSPAGGSHGNPHPTARIHIHTGRRRSCVAASGARAAGAPRRRIPQRPEGCRLCTSCRCNPRRSWRGRVHRRP
jgi:hypothetical protein